MTNAPTLSRPETLVDAPFDFAACEADSDWRNQVAWPVSHAATFALGQRISRALISWLNEEPGEARRATMLLAGGAVLAHSLALAERALAVDSERAAGIRLRASTPEIDYLRGAGAESDIPLLDLTFGPPVLAKPKGLMLRRFSRVASWSTLPRLVRNLLAPNAVAISHNALLRDCARHGADHVGFSHAEEIYRGISDCAASTPSDRTASLATEIVELFVGAAGIGGTAGRRLRALLAPLTQGFVERADVDLAAAASFPRLPERIWAGSGGYWPARCIAIEALRRGQHVRRFEHGGEAGMIEVTEPILLSELSVTSEFTCATTQMAERLKATGALSRIARIRHPEISGWQTAPHIRRLPLDQDVPAGARRNVLYGPSILLGPRQLFPPILPDPVHLDWQFRLVESLLSLPIDLVCRPHPEGLLYDRRHPLEAITSISPRRYEDLLPDSDVFLFDYGQSTTFYEALCTDRPVVFIDFGNPLFTSSVRTALERRCRIVHAWFDDRNRPMVDLDELSEAVCGGASTADPSEFREMLLGSA
ncbi:MAG: hypothetical protein QNJ92_00415 [Alphaproteobacteria bacterium]|nr:hypothetical protein [Alphaproteobacteria bacterium]